MYCWPSDCRTRKHTVPYPVDCYCPLNRQYTMLKLIKKYSDLADKALKTGVAVDKIAYLPVRQRFPVRAGMAGGSADAAAVLVGLNELYGARLSMSELCALGASIGADVPFALMGGTCRVQGVGDLLKPLPPVPDCWFTVVMPDYGVSTPEAFAAYDKVGSTVHPDCETQEAAVRAGDLDAVCAAAGNALEECSGAKDTGAIKALLREKGAVTALMTGSGSAVFGIFRDETSARAAAAAAKHRWKQVYTAQPDKGGARVV